MAVRERYVVTNGIRLFCLEDGPRSGPLVILVHGWPEFSWSWRHQLPALGGAGYHVVALDLPGFGRSDKPDVDYDEEWVNTTIAGLIPALDHEKAVVVGHDWGGLLVWPFARRFPELTAGVVGVNTPDIAHGPMSLVALLRMALPDQPPYIVQFQDYGPAEYFLGRDRSSVRSWLRFVYEGAAHRKDVITDEFVETNVDQFVPEGAVTTSVAYYRSLDRNWELRASLPDVIDAPALMLSAAYDPVLTPAMTEGMEERVPNVRKVVIDECGHWTQQEQPEETNRHLIEFLDGLKAWP
ncbi:MAG: epoxide hydrolase 4 [Acidimicrobiaceae bacterium]|jgi:non-specific protein-tyrosine kinase